MNAVAIEKGSIKAVSESLHVKKISEANAAIRVERVEIPPHVKRAVAKLAPRRLRRD